MNTSAASEFRPNYPISLLAMGLCFSGLPIWHSSRHGWDYLYLIAALIVILYTIVMSISLRRPYVDQKLRWIPWLCIATMAVVAFFILPFRLSAAAYFSILFLTKIRYEFASMAKAESAPKINGDAQMPSPSDSPEEAN